MLTTLNKPLLALALASLALNASAHRPWLLPSSTLVDGKENWITVDAAISENVFDIDHQPLALDALVITGPDGARIMPQNVSSGHLRNTFDVNLRQPGTYKAQIVTNSIVASYQLNGETKRWRGTEAAFAQELPAAAKNVNKSQINSRLETFFSALSTNDTVFKPSGVGLELVPLTHPNDVRAGEKVTWRFLMDGKPAAHQAFSLVLGGVRYRGVLGEIRQSTDAQGEVSFSAPAAGMYLLSSTWPAAAPVIPGQAAALSARRANYAATLEVLPQ